MSSNAVNALHNRKKVIIIGGGLAGIGAASVLVQDRKFHVRLLEGSSRLGGRVKISELPDGTKVSLGATFFHATELSNSVFKFGVDQHVIDEREGKVDGQSDSLHQLSDGTELNMATVALYEDVLEKIFEDLEEKCKFNDCEEKPDERMSLYEYLSKEFIDHTMLMKNAPSLPCSMRDLLNGFLNWEGVTAGSKLLKNVSALTFGVAGCNETRSALYFNEGTMGTIVDAMTNKLPSEVIHFNSEVETIHWNQSDSNHPVLVCCSNGVQYSADHVIVTVSLGVLKEKLKSSAKPFFSPPLPLPKQQAIERLGFGVVNKLIFQTPEPLFNKKYESIFFYWKKENEDILEKYPWLQGLDEIQQLPEKNLYLCWFVEDDAIAIENLSDEVIRNGFTILFEKFFNISLPNFTALSCSKWGSDNFQYGGYSYPALGTSQEDIINLATPVNGSTHLQLMFAGEATHLTLFSTVQGAYDTGIREATRLRKLYNN